MSTRREIRGLVPAMSASGTSAVAAGGRLGRVGRPVDQEVQGGEHQRHLGDDGDRASHQLETLAGDARRLQVGLVRGGQAHQERSHDGRGDGAGGRHPVGRGQPEARGERDRVGGQGEVASRRPVEPSLGDDQLEVERHGRDDRCGHDVHRGQVSGSRRGRAHTSRHRGTRRDEPEPLEPSHGQHHGRDGPRRDDGRAHPAARDQIGLGEAGAREGHGGQGPHEGEGTRRTSGGCAGVDRAIDGSGHGGHDRAPS